MARTGRASFGLPPHVRRVRLKGKEYFYFQAHRGTWQQGPRVKLPGAPFEIDGSPDADWWACYRRISGAPEKEVRPGSFAALFADFKASPEWRALAPATREGWQRWLSYVESAWAELPVRGIEIHHILKLRDKFADKPATANNVLRALSAVLSWGVPRKFLVV